MASKSELVKNPALLDKTEVTEKAQAKKSTRFIQLGVGIAISVVCLWLALRTVPFFQLIQALTQANYLWLIPAVILALILNLIRSEIWRLLLEKRISVADAFWAYSTGFLFNNIFPFRLGEAARIAILATHRRLPLVEVAATAGLERLLDVISLVLIVVAIIPFMDMPAAVKQGALLFGSLSVMGLIVVFTLAKLGKRSEIWVRRLLRPLPNRYTEMIVARWQELVQGLTVLTRPSIGLPALSGALLVWGCTIAMQWCVLRAFQPQAGLIEAAFMTVAVSLAIALPAAPGFIGIFQWVGQQALVVPFPHLYTPGIALGIAIVTHLTSYLLSTGLGLIGLWYFGQSFSGVGRLVKKPQPTSPLQSSLGDVNS